MLNGYPLAAPLLAQKKGRSNPHHNWSNANATIIVSEFPIFAPVLVQMPVVHEPSLQFLQFATHLPALFSKVPCFCPLLFRELAMLGFNLCDSRKAVLGPWASGGPAMELTAPHRESSGALAQGTPTGPSLAPNTLPVWAVEPWFGIGFHCAQLSSIHGVLLYLILEVIARHAWLGPRTVAREKPSNTN
jgi:hypothetical protein